MHISMDESSTTSDDQQIGSLPGFRFHPTEEELLNFYLKSVVLGKKLQADIIGFLNIYNHDPVELPGLAKIGEREWYFLVDRDRKHGSGGRPNRTTRNGFWKATGSDRKVLSASSDPKKKNMLLGLRKTLVFYEGRAPCGRKTDWVMNEYRLPPEDTAHGRSSRDDVVLCKVYRKATSLKVLEQMAAMDQEEEVAVVEEEEEEEVNTKMYTVNSTIICGGRPSPPPPLVSISFDQNKDDANSTTSKDASRMSAKSQQVLLPNRRANNSQFQVPPKLTMDWNQQDYSFWALENLNTFLPTF